MISAPNGVARLQLADTFRAAAARICGIAQYAGNVCSPSVERLRSLREKRMVLVNSRNSCNRARLVVRGNITPRTFGER